ncbi:MAG: type II toxin-antitoxin system VapC family toxin [Cyanobium sp.]
MTRLLLETHLLLWWLSGDPRLPRQVDLPDLERQVPLQGFHWLPIRNSHLLAVGELESDGAHKDPFDRLLVCQSRTEPLLLLTGDSQLKRYGSTVILVA